MSVWTIGTAWTSSGRRFTERLVYQSLTQGSFGKLRLYGTVRVGKDRQSWQELECFLFTEMLICVKEKRGAPPQYADGNSKRKLTRCTLKGSILIKKHLKHVDSGQGLCIRFERKAVGANAAQMNQSLRLVCLSRISSNFIFYFKREPRSTNGNERFSTWTPLNLHGLPTTTTNKTIRAPTRTTTEQRRTKGYPPSILRLVPASRLQQPQRSIPTLSIPTMDQPSRRKTAGYLHLCMYLSTSSWSFRFHRPCKVSRLRFYGMHSNFWFKISASGIAWVWLRLARVEAACRWWV